MKIYFFNSTLQKWQALAAIPQIARRRPSQKSEPNKQSVKIGLLPNANQLCHGFAYRAWEPWALRARALTNLNMVAKASGPESGAWGGYRKRDLIISELRHGRDCVRS